MTLHLYVFDHVPPSGPMVMRGDSCGSRAGVKCRGWVFFVLFAPKVFKLSVLIQYFFFALNCFVTLKIIGFCFRGNGMVKMLRDFLLLVLILMKLFFLNEGLSFEWIAGWFLASELSFYLVSCALCWALEQRAAASSALC